MEDQNDPWLKDFCSYLDKLPDAEGVTSEDLAAMGKFSAIIGDYAEFESVVNGGAVPMDKVPLATLVQKAGFDPKNFYTVYQNACDYANIMDGTYEGLSHERVMSLSPDNRKLYLEKMYEVSPEVDLSPTGP